MSRKGESLFEDEEEEEEEDEDDDPPKISKPSAVSKIAVDSDDEDDEDKESDSDSSSAEDDLEEHSLDEENEVPLELMRGFDDISEYESEDEDNYLQKLDDQFKKNISIVHHPESVSHNHEEIETMSKVVRNERGQIIDPLHKTMPFITKYERARVIGERAMQINAGAQVLIEVDASIIDGYEIALREFEAKKTPFIIKRPLPNGGIEYWRLADLEFI